MSFLFQNLRLIPSRIHDAEETKGFFEGIAQLVRRVRRDIESIQEIQEIHLPACAHLSFPPDTNHHVLMSVLLEAAVSARRYLKISEVESRGFSAIPHNDPSHNVSPIPALRLIEFSFYALPGKVAFMFVKFTFVCSFSSWHSSPPSQCTKGFRESRVRGYDIFTRTLESLSPRTLY